MWGRRGDCFYEVRAPQCAGRLTGGQSGLVCGSAGCHPARVLRLGQLCVKKIPMWITVPWVVGDWGIWIGYPHGLRNSRRCVGIPTSASLVEQPMAPPNFLGTYQATLDAEGRIQLPAALRDEINFRQPDFRLMATLDGDGSVCLRERADWERWTLGLLGAREPLRQQDRRTLLTVAAHSAPAKCDKQGRVRVSDALLTVLGLDRSKANAREVVLAGAFQEIRLWSAAGWEEFSSSARRTLGADLDELLAPPGSMERLA